MPDWKEYTGSDEQLAEIWNAESGYSLRFTNELDTEIRFAKTRFTKREFITHCGLKKNITHYLICNPHPLVEMIRQQARTGQPVWVKMKSSTYWIIAMRGFDLIYQDHVVSVIKSITPDWNIPNAKYSFTEFKEEV